MMILNYFVGRVEAVAKPDFYSVMSGFANSTHRRQFKDISSCGRGFQPLPQEIIQHFVLKLTPAACHTRMLRWFGWMPTGIHSVDLWVS